MPVATPTSFHATVFVLPKWPIAFLTVCVGHPIGHVHIEATEVLIWPLQIQVGLVTTPRKTLLQSIQLPVQTSVSEASQTEANALVLCSAQRWKSFTKTR